MIELYKMVSEDAFKLKNLKCFNNALILSWITLIKVTRGNHYLKKKQWA